MHRPAPPPHHPSPDDPGAPAHTPHPGDDATIEPVPMPPARARARAGLFRAASWALRILLPIGVLLVVWHEVSHLNFRRTSDIVHASDWHYIVAAIGAAFISIAAMGAYDVFAFTSTPSLTPLRRWGRASIIFAWTNFLTLGPLGGPALRLYLYRRAGMTIPEILRGIVRLYIAFFAGLTAWLAAVFTPIDGPGSLPARIVIALALAPVLALLAARVLHRLRPGASGPWPAQRIAILGLLGVIDWGAALATFALTARALSLPTDLDDLAKTLYLGQFVGIASMVPGGLGSADAVWLNMLTGPGVSTDTAAAQVLLFRLTFYIVPWAASLIGLYIMFTGTRVRAGLWRRRIIAGAVAINAGFLLASSATPAVHDRLLDLRSLVPLPVTEVSHAASVVAALFMLLLVRGLLRGYRAAYLITAASLAASTVAHLLKGGDYEEALVCTALLALLIGVRGAFPRRGRIPLGWELTLALALGALTFYILLGLTAFRGVHPLHELLLHFGNGVSAHTQAARFLRAAVILAIAGLVVLLRQAVYPPKGADLASDDDIARILELARARAHRTAALLIAAGDKAAWFFRAGGREHGAAVYQRRGNTMVVLADPIAVPGAERELLEALHETADDEDLHLVFYQISGAWMEHLHDFGYTFFKLGEEAIVDLPGFRLEGGQAHSFRKMLRRASEQGLTFEVLSPPHPPELIAQCRAISDAWLAAKDAREMQFSVGYFSPAYLQRGPLAIVRTPDARPVAFVNILTAGPGAEASFDLMRYRDEGIDGLMDYLIIQLALWAKERGYSTLNLGMSPLHDVGDWKKAVMTERLARQLFRHGERVYNYKGLHIFKSKFHPAWEPRYLAYQRPWYWADAVLMSSSLILARSRADRRRIAAARTE
ncbi:MAG: bifunctional lysylphosphatidylglycerol flippase/synthetase MprF [Phycisphaerales bacterium]|nr:bifunctional lysylphosphatidylglycerol flippase/synthetase MprF [Phycisphaerales bacterium]